VKKPTTLIYRYLLALAITFGVELSGAMGQNDMFDCNGDLIITLYNNSGGATTAFNIELEGFTANFGTLSSFPIQVNSTGFNSQDGYIYGVSDFGNFIRLKADGTFDNLGKPPGFPNVVFSAAGDFDANGIYWIHERITNKFFAIDLASFTIVQELQFRWHASTGNSGVFLPDIDDLVFDPLNKTSMYTYQRNYENTPSASTTNGHLLRVDLDPDSDTYGFIFDEGQLDPSIIIHLGAMFFDSQGKLFGYGIDPADNPIQNRLIRIDRDPAQAQVVARGPGASSNDGCSCPFSLYVTKATDDNYSVCESELMQFDYIIGNSSNVSPDGVTFRDSFPTGFEIVDIQFSEEFGRVVPGTGIGTNKLIIEDIDFANQEVEFTVLVRPTLQSNFYNIQAELTNLPTRFGEIILSDDPESLASNDPTFFVVDYEQFQTEFEIGDDAIICDGEIAEFTATLPLPNTDVVWNTGAQGVFVQSDETQTLIATATLGACSATDTVEVTVLPYPEIALGDDQEPCLGDDVVLSALTDPSFEYQWSSGQLSPDIEATSSGLYIVTVSNQQCSTTDSIMIDYTFEEFEKLFLDTAICEGTSISFDSNNELGAAPSWTLPDGSSTESAIVNIAAASSSDAGQYQIQLEANDCFLDRSFELNVNLEPELQVDREVAFDICDSIILDIASYDPTNSVVWTPADILACPECPSTPAVTTSDQWLTVTVQDEIGCSTTDSIFLDIVDQGLGDPIHIPNVFTPNDDRANDFFVVLPLCYRIETFKIYDRWGNLVYVKPAGDATVEWDGYHNGQIAEMGVYTWFGEFTFVNTSESRIVSGDVTLIR